MANASQYWNAIYAEKAYKDAVFHPEEPTATVFDAQLAFLKDPSPTKMARCGNRSAKTFTHCRDASWAIMYKNPYIPELYVASDEEYMNTKPRIIWFLGPDLSFLYQVMWKQYLEVMIPQWYYTNDDLVSMVQMDKDKGKDIIHSVQFRNGDVLEFKAYSQNLLSKMGRACDRVYIDEAPKDVKIIVECATRVLDKGGTLSLAFTPVDVPDDVIEWVETHPTLSQHRWSMLDNPVFRDNPEKRERALSEYANLPEHIRNMRLYGDWCESDTGLRVFENSYLEEVEDFAIPLTWRRVRVADPASHRTGVSFYAEDPNTGDWYCYLAYEIEWKGRIAKATDIEKEIDRSAPYQDYQYFMSLYDNAAAWFQAHAEHTQGFWIPCILKNKELLVTLTRQAVEEKRIKFFKNGARPLILQYYKYKRKDDGSIHKKSDHLVDTLQYFARQIPDPLPADYATPLGEAERINRAWLEEQKREWKQIRDTETRSPFDYALSQETVRKLAKEMVVSIINRARR